MPGGSQSAGASSRDASVSVTGVAVSVGVDGPGSAPDGQEMRTNRLLEDDAVRREWGFNDNLSSLGVMRDALSTARPVADFGFGVSSAAMRLGFGVATNSLKRIRDESEARGFSRVAKVARVGEASARGMRRVAEGIHRVAQRATTATLDAAVQEFEEEGVQSQPGALLRRALGADEVAACLAVARTATQLFRGSGVELGAISPLDLVGRFRQYALCQPRREQSVDGGVVDIAHYCHWMWLSAAVYGLARNWAMGLFLKCSSSRFITAAAAEHGCTVLLDVTSQPVEMYRPQHAVFCDDNRRAIVVAVRGTGNLRDTLTDLVCEAASLNGGELRIGDPDASLVHLGMWRSARRLFDELAEPVRTALDNKPNHQLLLTGHSLGAGVAALLCLLWRPKLRDRVQCVAFGPPAILDIASARTAAAHGVTSVILDDDLVPFLSLRSSIDLVRAVVQSPPSVHRPVGTETTDVPADYSAVPALFPAGRLLHIQAKDESGNAGSSHKLEVYAREVDPEMFRQISVSPTMLIRHLPRAYLTAFGGLRTPVDRILSML